MSLIHTIDLQYLGTPGMIASYVIVGPAGPVLVETGPASCLEQLERGLGDHGMSLDDIEHALVTHIHLDHAGAAGHLAERGVTIYVHEFGAAHLIDPAKLIASASRIYGKDMDRLWGRIVPVPKEQIVAVADGEVLDIAGLRFTVMETPGHARHHHAFSLMAGQGSVCFTGDAAGMIIPDLGSSPKNARTTFASSSRFINLPTPPPEFDLEAWMTSIERMERARFKTLYLTHFGAVHTPLIHLTAVKQALRSHTAYVRAQHKLGRNEAAITESYAKWMRMKAERAGASREQIDQFVSNNLLRMNVTGIVRYLTQMQPRR